MCSLLEKAPWAAEKNGYYVMLSGVFCGPYALVCAFTETFAHCLVSLHDLSLG